MLQQSLRLRAPSLTVYVVLPGPSSSNGEAIPASRPAGRRLGMRGSSARRRPAAREVRAVDGQVRPAVRRRRREAEAARGVPEERRAGRAVQLHGKWRVQAR